MCSKESIKHTKAATFHTEPSFSQSKLRVWDQLKDAWVVDDFWRAVLHTGAIVVKITTRLL